jgi:hypothetical protein
MDLAQLRKEAEWGYRIPSEREWIEWAYNEGLKEGKANPVENRVMPMLTETEVRSGWEGWLNNSYKYFEKEFKSSLKTSASRDAVPQTVRIWMGKYYKDLLEITKSYLDASKHSA